jgi:hypothetical protein
MRRRGGIGMLATGPVRIAASAATLQGAAPVLELLSDGSALLRSETCSFTTTRVCPGRLLTTVRGHDDGRLGREPMRQAERESLRFKTPVTWFIDARDAHGVSGGVLDLWTEWLGSRPDCLGRLHMLLGRRAMALKLQVAQHLSGIGDRMRLHDSLGTFEEALGHRAGASSRPEAVPMRVDVEPLPRHGFEIKGDQLAYRFEQPPGDTVYTTVHGREAGAVGDAPMDGFDRLLEQLNRPIRWRLDLRGVRYVSHARALAWSAWLTAREACFKEIVVLAPSPSVAMFLLGAQYRFGKPDLMRVVRDAGEFDAGRGASS